MKANSSVVQVPTDALTCHDVVCNKKSHFAALNDYSDALITACLEAASNTIPRSSRTIAYHSSKVMPGWNEHVAPLRDKSILWHDIWVGCTMVLWRV